MPNLKIHVDASLWKERQAALTAALAPIRAMLCERLDVDVSACQLALVPVWGLEGQPLINAEIFVLPWPERTRPALESLCRALQARLMEATEGARTAVRCSGLDPQVYLAIK